MDEFERLSAIIAEGARSPADRVEARLRRGLLLMQLARFPDAALDFAAVMEDPHSTPDQRGRALNDRAAVFTISRQPELALRDLETVIEDASIPAEIRAMALNNAAVAYEDAGNVARAIEIYRLALEDPSLDLEGRCMKRLALANALKADGRMAEANIEFDALLNDAQTPAQLKRSAEYFKNKPAP